MMFVLRAVNYCRTMHLPSYVALRMLLDGLGQHNREKWLRLFIQRRSTTRRRQSFYRYMLYKGTRGGNHEYRIMFAPSPMSALAESHLLEVLAKQEAFQPHRAVYSYRWPSPNSGHAFEYYYKGYQARQNKISELLAADNNLCLVYVDIRGFYPSLKKDRVRDAFQKRLNQSSMDELERSNALSLVDDTLAVSSSGVPIGPAISHLLSSIALTEADNVLYERFGGAYSRYVDDVAVVTSADNASAAIKMIENVFASEHLSLNPDKTFVISSGLWSKSLSSGEALHRFGELREAITYYLAFYPERLTMVHEALGQAGFNLPLDQFSSAAKYSKLRSFISAVFSRRRTAIMQSLVGGIDRLVRDAEVVRKQLETELAVAQSSDIPASGFERRFALRSYSRLLNRLLYMYPLKDLGLLLPKIPLAEELENIRSLVQACCTKDATRLLNFPGPTVASFAQLWGDRQSDTPTVNWPKQLGGPELEASAVLAVSGTTHLPRQFLHEPNRNEAHAFAAFCADEPASARERDDFQYIDEIRTLQMDSRRRPAKEYLKLRYDEGESVVLDALMLGLEYYGVGE